MPKEDIHQAHLDQIKKETKQLFQQQFLKIGLITLLIYVGEVILKSLFSNTQGTMMQGVIQNALFLLPLVIAVIMIESIILHFIVNRQYKKEIEKLKRIDQVAEQAIYKFEPFFQFDKLWAEPTFFNHEPMQPEVKEVASAEIENFLVKRIDQIKKLKLNMPPEILKVTEYESLIQLEHGEMIFERFQQQLVNQQVNQAGWNQDTYALTRKFKYYVHEALKSYQNELEKVREQISSNELAAESYVVQDYLKEVILFREKIDLLERYALTMSSLYREFLINFEDVKKEEMFNPKNRSCYSF